jgi:uncharacterized membrane protein YbhN (UPF0104 family)
MNKLLSNILKFSLSLGLGILLVWLAVRNLTGDDIAKMKDASTRANYFWLILGASFGMVSNYIRALRWKLLLEPLGYKPGTANTFYAVLIMYFGNLAFPRLGEVSRCAILNRYENIPIDKSIGTMITERLVDLVTILLIGGLLFIFEFDVLEAYFIKTFMGGNSAQGGSLKFIILGIGAAAALFGYLFLTQFKSHPLVAKALGVINGFMDGLKSIFRLKNPFLFILYSILVWLCYTLMVVIAFKALPETSGMTFMVGLALVFFGGFAFVATQGGIGAYPLVVREILLLYGVSAAIGYAFGWIVWTVQTIMVLLAGVIALVLLAINNKTAEQE